ncbi:unnamed protein product [Rhizophagus irregularis]|nr:unnamed protein product [Rhizophagus irregularis]
MLIFCAIICYLTFDYNNSEKKKKLKFNSHKNFTLHKNINTLIGRKCKKNTMACRSLMKPCDWIYTNFQNMNFGAKKKKLFPRFPFLEY